MTDTDKTETIRQHNDVFRVTGTGGKIVFTGALALEPEEFRNQVYERVRLYRDFSEGKDPHGEHDYGHLKVSGKDIMWKIDYYDANMEYGSEDPADPAQTTRLLSIFFAEDY